MVQIIVISGIGLSIPMISFPLSIPVYLSAGIILEIFYRLVLLVIPVWFVSSLLLKNRWPEMVFWVILVLFSLSEPFQQTLAMSQMGLLPSPFWTVALFVLVLTGNIIPGYLLRKSGFLAAVGFRLSDYFVWHILWGGFFL
ncbi:MAG: hypothetical protein ABRQ23_02155 [Syntrophomonadaceae bacterium]